MREPLLGQNAKPLFVQLSVGVLTYLTLYWIRVGDLLFWLSCNFLTGSCR